MSKSKPKILLCWGYHRKSWVAPFNKLSDDFEFSYLFQISKSENEINHAKNTPIYYWKDFASAQEIIEKLKPEKIVFIGIEGINSIALNIVAKNKGIETIALQHGMFHSYSDYLNWAKEELKVRQKTGNFNQSAVEVDRKFLLSFFLRSVVFVNPLALAFMLKLQYLKRRYLEVEAVKNAPSKFRTASKYVVFTKENASIYYERDGIDKNDLIEIGNPEMDHFFNYVSQAKPNEDNYYLLIDEPWSEMKEYDSPGYGITKEQTNDFYRKLAEFAESKSAKLKIKLHPYSYTSDFLLSHPNIEYLKDTDVVKLILESKGVFGYSSTLTLPAIYFSRCCLFKIWEESNYQDEIKQLELAQILYYHQFDVEDIDFESYQKEQTKMDKFVEKFFYKADGKAVQRLKEVLQKDVV